MLEGAVDVNRIDGLLAGLLLLDWRREPGSRDSWAAPRPAAPIRQHVEPATPAAAALLPFFHGSPLAATGRDGQPIVVTLRPPRSWATQLARGGPAGLTNVLADALHRLRVEGLRPTPSVLRPTPGENGPVLAAAALCGMSSTTAERFLAQTCPPVDLLTP